MSDIKLDGDAAVVGGIHSDSHNTENNYTTHNTTTTHNNTINNSTVYEAQKTQAEISQQNESLFLQAVQERLADGILDQKGLVELNQLSFQWHIPPVRAGQIIEQMRKSCSLKQCGKGNEYLAEQLINEVHEAVVRNQTDILNRKFAALEQLANVMDDSNVQFYYHLLLASFYPDKCVVSFINSRTDNYWQLFWAHVAYIKLGDADSATALLPRLGGFGGVEEGNIALLMAIDNLADYFRNDRDERCCQQAEQYLNQAGDLNISEQVAYLWLAVKEMLHPGPKPQRTLSFYIETTFAELLPKPKSKTASALKVPSPPPVPKFNAQTVHLDQMQGFNPLQAAKQMGIGKRMTSFQQTQATLNKMMGSGIPKKSATMPPPMPGTVQPAASHSFTPPKVVTPQVDESLDEPDPLEDHFGIILTDSAKLAEKYSCSQQEVLDVFNAFVQTAYDQQMYWDFVDICDADIDKTDCDAINGLIDRHIDEKEMTPGIQLHLLIVGGLDVIPVPCIEDPWEFGCENIPTDMPYCFFSTRLTDMLNGDVELNLTVKNVRNNVARLPLEEGPLSTDINSDLGAYFNVSGLYEGGIPVGNVVMISNSEWIPASSTMTQHLPLLYDTDDPSLVCGGMYISPEMLTANEEALATYRQSLQNADMLMFNLHGSDFRGKAGFYSTDEAFNASLLRDSNARVFTTVACYGARYIGYERDDSMLLQSLYGGGILLYTGSLVPVPMFSNANDEARQLLLNPGTGSEVLMRLYPLYLFKGMTAGEALLRAKLDYFNMCRHIESDSFSLSTALMFCLYGNPMLHVRQRANVVESALQNESIPPTPVVAEKGYLKTTVINQVLKTDGGKSLVEQIQSHTDSNLRAIHRMVEQTVYFQLGLPVRWLESVDQFRRPTIDGYVTAGYAFHYHNPEAKFSADAIVETDEKGHLKRIYTMK